MNRPIEIYDGPDACTKCLGWKHIANDEEQSPWKYWAELPAPSNIAVTLGLVYPIECPHCHGSGIEPTTTTAPGGSEEAAAAGADLALVARLTEERDRARAELEALRSARPVRVKIERPKHMLDDAAFDRAVEIQVDDLWKLVELLSEGYSVIVSKPGDAGDDVADLLICSWPTPFHATTAAATYNLMLHEGKLLKLFGAEVPELPAD